MKKLILLIGTLLLTLTMYGQCYETMLNKGDALKAQGKYSQAIECYQDAKGCKPTNEGVLDARISACKKAMTSQRSTPVSIPTVTTYDVFGVESDRAQCGGRVTSSGGASVTAYGVCWSTSPHPTRNDYTTVDGRGVDDFYSTMTHLRPGTTYYVRAYATNSKGTAYGDEKCFSTEKPKPIVKIAHRSSGTIDRMIGQDTAYIVFEVSCENNPQIKEVGVYYSTEPSAKSSGEKCIMRNNYGCGEYSFKYLGTRDAAYYFWPYVISGEEQVLGDRIDVQASKYAHQKQQTESQNKQVCNGVKDYDGNEYKTVELGSQCWMAENLRTTHYSNGTSISQGSSESSTTGYWYYPDGNSGNKRTYGLLYNWPAVMQGSSSSERNPSGVQGICPTGWHVPSEAEWTQLTDYVGSQSRYRCGGNAKYIAKALASTTGWINSSEPFAVGNNPNLNNYAEFTAEPTGWRNYGKLQGVNANAYFWSSTSPNYWVVYCFGINFSRAGVMFDEFDDHDGLPVRCLRNNND